MTDFRAGNSPIPHAAHICFQRKNKMLRNLDKNGPNSRQNVVKEWPFCTLDIFRGAGYIMYNFIKQPKCDDEDSTHAVKSSASRGR